MPGGILSQHLLIIGSTGAGKSETIKRLVAETLADTDWDIFFIDGKGDSVLAGEIAQTIFCRPWTGGPAVYPGL